ncbi:hypothetical protein B296_00037695, partial [Ensete ventricosum]
APWIKRIPPAVYLQYSPCGVHSSPSPHHSHEVSSHLRRRKVLPFCYRLLNQDINVVAEIVQASGLAANRTFVDHERIDHVTPLRSTRHPSNGGPMDLEE